MYLSKKGTHLSLLNHCSLLEVPLQTSEFLMSCTNKVLQLLLLLYVFIKLILTQSLIVVDQFYSTQVCTCKTHVDVIVLNKN